VSYFDDFLNVMTAGIARFAPHVIQLRTGLRGNPGLATLLGWCDVLIHSTGAEYVRDGLTGGQTAIEYRHTPDALCVRTEILPAIEAVRAQHTEKDPAHEDKRQQLVRGRALPAG
jgi:GntR family transcriptional regulator